jgi:hypothetical protein
MSPLLTHMSICSAKLILTSIFYHYRNMLHHFDWYQQVALVVFQDYWVRKRQSTRRCYILGKSPFLTHLFSKIFFSFSKRENGLEKNPESWFGKRNGTIWKKIPNHRMLFWYTLRDERFISIRVRENFETKFTDIMFFDQTAPQSAVAKSHIEDSVPSPFRDYDLTKEILQRTKKSIRCCLGHLFQRFTLCKRRSRSWR